MNVVLRDLDLHFQFKTFSCYIFSIPKKEQAANVPGHRREVALVNQSDSGWCNIAVFNM